jgi:hypothetical protein
MLPILVLLLLSAVVHLAIFCITMQMRFFAASTSVQRGNDSKMRDIRQRRGGNDLIGTHHSFLNPVDNPHMQSSFLDILGKVSSLPYGLVYTQKSSVCEQASRGVRVFDVRVDCSGDCTDILVSHANFHTTLTLASVLSLLEDLPKGINFWLYISCSYGTKHQDHLKTMIGLLIDPWGKNNPHFTVVFSSMGFESIWFTDITNQQQYEAVVNDKLKTYPAAHVVCVSTFCTPALSKTAIGIALVVGSVFLSFCVSTGLIIRRFTRRSNRYGKQGGWTENIAVVVTVFLVYHCVTTLTFVLLSKTYALSVSCAEARQFNPFIVQNRKIAWMCDFI